MKGLAGASVRHKVTGQTARVEYEYPGLNGVRLDRIVAGFYSWHLTDLQVLRKKRKKKEN